MTPKPKRVVGFLIVGVLAICAGIYLYLGQSNPQIIIKEVPVVQAQETLKPTAVSSKTAKSASGWISGKQPSYTPCANLPLYKPSVVISSDRLSCTVVVPATESNGVKAIDASGKEFSIHSEDNIEISANGTIKFSDDHPCVDPEGMAGWYDNYVDSPFSKNVGGLEFSIGELSANRYFAGKHYAGKVQASGVPVFRIVERAAGYFDNNSGAFTVTVRKTK